jgi:dephospho-CoA kinase
MVLLGLTGGVGMGKSVAAEYLTLRGVPVVDTDTLARDLAGPGSPVVHEISQSFGATMLDEAGRLRRARLAELVFADPAARARLEAILHPPIAAAWRKRVSAWRTQGKLIAAVVIPLLFEKNYGAEFDRVVCLACSPETQLRRLQERGWTETHIRARNAAQLPPAEKMTRAGFVVWTEGSLDVHHRQWQRILATVADVANSPA